jgi:hypothetical protein
MSNTELNTTGPISIGGSTVGQSINLEINRAAGATTSLNDTRVRQFGVDGATGAVSMNNFYGRAFAEHYIWGGDDLGGNGNVTAYGTV